MMDRVGTLLLPVDALSFSDQCEPLFCRIARVAFDAFTVVEIQSDDRVRTSGARLPGFTIRVMYPDCITRLLFATSHTTQRVVVIDGDLLVLLILYLTAAFQSMQFAMQNSWQKSSSYPTYNVKHNVDLIISHSSQ